MEDDSCVEGRAVLFNHVPMDSLGIDRRKIDRGVRLLSDVHKQSEIDIPMDKTDVLFDSDSPIKWDRIVLNRSSEQGGKLWESTWHFADA